MTKYCLLHRKTAVSLRQNGHFRASDNWFLMCKWQENNAQNIYCVCNVLIECMLQLHTDLWHFYARRIFIFKYLSLNASTKSNV